MSDYVMIEIETMCISHSFPIFTGSLFHLQKHGATLRRIVNNLVHKRHNVVALEGKQNKGGGWVWVDCTVCASDTAWVDEVLAVVLDNLVLVGVT